MGGCCCCCFRRNGTYSTGRNKHLCHESLQRMHSDLKMLCIFFLLLVCTMWHTTIYNLKERERELAHLQCKTRKLKISHEHERNNADYVKWSWTRTGQNDERYMLCAVAWYCCVFFFFVARLRHRRSSCDGTQRDIFIKSFETTEHQNVSKHEIVLQIRRKRHSWNLIARKTNSIIIERNFCKAWKNNKINNVPHY